MRNPVEDSASTLHTALLQHHRQLSMSSYTTSTNTYVILKYSRSWPDLGGGQSSEWEHVNSPRLRIRLNIVTPSDSAEGHPRYCLKVFDDLSSSQTLQSSQTLSENVWVSRSSWFAVGRLIFFQRFQEEVDLTSFSELRAPYPIAGTPLRAVYRDKTVAFRYIFPCGSGGHSQVGSLTSSFCGYLFDKFEIILLSKPAEAVHRRFQVHFASYDDAEALIRSIRNVCPCVEKPDQQQPITTVRKCLYVVAAKRFLIFTRYFSLRLVCRTRRTPLHSMAFKSESSQRSTPPLRLPG